MPQKPFNALDINCIHHIRFKNPRDIHVFHYYQDYYNTRNRTYSYNI